MTRGRLLLETALVVVAVRVALTVLPFGVVHRAATRPRRARAGVPCERIADAVLAVCRVVPRATCLTQVLSAGLLYARHGHPAALRLGITRRDGRVVAHAWLEHDGRAIFGEPEAGTFVRLG